MSDEKKSPLPHSISEQYAMWLRGEFDVPTDTYWEDRIAALEKRLAQCRSALERYAPDVLDELENTHD